MPVSMLYKTYSSVLNHYQQISKSKKSITKFAIEKTVILLVTILQLTSGIKFPKRSIGGWWWTWRIRFEIITGFFDYYVSEYCQQLIKPGMIVVDIGAHVGYYTWLFSKLVGPSGKVISYEPSPENFQILVQNLRAKNINNVIPIQKAVCDCSKPVKLYLSPGNSNHSIVKGFTNFEDVIEVAATTIDLGVKELGYAKLDFIKIDAEGAEPAILRGMSSILKESEEAILIIEMNPFALRASSFNPADLIEQLSYLNFDPKIILVDGSLSTDFSSFYDHTVNLLCLQKVEL